MQVRDQVLERILDGRLRPGAVNETHLAELLNVSRTPVREALLTLSPLVWRRGRGFELSALSAREAKEVYPLVGTLESLALDYVSLPLSPQALADLSVANSKVRSASDPREALESDMNWHRTLLSFSRNRTVCALAEKYRLVITRYEIAYFSAGGALDTAADDHDAVLDLLQREDVERAKEVLRENWLRGVSAIAETVEWL